MNVKTLVLAIAGISALAFGLSYVGCSADDGLNKYEKMAKDINSQHSSWTAATNPTINVPEERLKSYFNLIVEPVPEGFDEAPVTQLTVADLPEQFDAREQWPKCESIREVRDQSACGSCWAFGAATAMSDRVCIHSNQQNQSRISTEDLLECCRICGMGCNGGYLYTTWLHWRLFGIVTGGLYQDTNWCKPYAFPPCNHHSKGPYEDCSKYNFKTPKCQKKCENPSYGKSYDQDKIKASKVYNLRGESNIMKDLVENGPVEAAIQVFEDFLLYTGGVYQHKTGSFLGGHAIRIIGYGVDNGVKYWLCVNSWNDSWGEKGTFRFLRGSDHCGIESGVVTGIPKL
jgi:cathepsin B